MHGVCMWACTKGAARGQFQVGIILRNSSFLRQSVSVLVGQLRTLDSPLPLLSVLEPRSSDLLGKCFINWTIFTSLFFPFPFLFFILLFFGSCFVHPPTGYLSLSLLLSYVCLCEGFGSPVTVMSVHVVLESKSFKSKCLYTICVPGAPWGSEEPWTITPTLYICLLFFFSPPC